MRIQAGQSYLLVVDIQERLAPAVAEPEQVIANTARLLQAAHRLDIPVLASEQYPRGIGQTVAALRALLPPRSVMEKMHFSCLDDGACAERIRSLQRRQAVVAGMEAHVCVLQTAEGLIEAGYDVFVVADAVSSRVPANHDRALQRLSTDGAHIVSTEMVLFEWLNKAGTPVFRELMTLIK
ncbi:MAG: hydrolase [Rhodospirillales bacterium]|nr:MAG: hydrolase [Rhodospirillales bacterium]